MNVRRSLGSLVVIAALGAASATQAAEGAHWTYKGHGGPPEWGSMDTAFASCQLGKLQSPIDIVGAKPAKLPPIKFNYQPSALKIIDNGHTIQVNYAPGSTVSVAGTRYELVQFHFHKPSEEKISGKGHDMEAHLVHRSKDGKVAVLAVLLDEGKESALIKTLWANLPQTKDKENVVDAVKINALELIPRDKGYYAFAGSLTTPPCSEDVKWFVLKTPMQISADEIARFAKSYPMNARPVQELNARDIQATR
jgi:carbonic anhydrase